MAEFDNSKGKSTPKGVPRKFPSKDLKKKIAIVSFLGALGLLLSTRFHFFGVPSKDHCAHAFPTEEVCYLTAPISEIQFLSLLCHRHSIRLFKIYNFYQNI